MTLEAAREEIHQEMQKAKLQLELSRYRVRSLRIKKRLKLITFYFALKGVEPAAIALSKLNINGPQRRWNGAISELQNAADSLNANMEAVISETEI